jgi:hypothetical protein
VGEHDACRVSLTPRHEGCGPRVSVDVLGGVLVSLHYVELRRRQVAGAAISPGGC